MKAGFKPRLPSGKPHQKSRHVLEMKSYSFVSVQALMRQRWPHLFGPGVYVPLQIDIDVKIFRSIKSDPDLHPVPLSHIRAFLRDYCSGIGYLQAIVEQRWRAGLPPKSRVGFVSKGQKIRAQERLDELQRMAAARAA